MSDDCAYSEECSNLGKACFKCFNFNKYKPLKEVSYLKTRSNSRTEKKEGMDFENRGTRNYNKAVKVAKQVASRQLASGALHFALGDMITEEELTASLSEFKERGTKDASGAKQITIKREWLEKLSEEAKQMGRDFYFLPFSFKGSSKDYVALDYDILLAYVQTIQTLLEQNRLLRKQVEASE